MLGGRRSADLGLAGMAAGTGLQGRLAADIEAAVAAGERWAVAQCRAGDCLCTATPLACWSSCKFPFLPLVTRLPARSAFPTALPPLPTPALSAGLPPFLPPSCLCLPPFLHSSCLHLFAPCPFILCCSPEIAKWSVERYADGRMGLEVRVSLGGLSFVGSLLPGGGSGGIGGGGGAAAAQRRVGAGMSYGGVGGMDPSAGGRGAAAAAAAFREAAPSTAALDGGSARAAAAAAAAARGLLPAVSGVSSDYEVRCLPCLLWVALPCVSAQQ
jgi:hypothetical protein